MINKFSSNLFKIVLNNKLFSKIKPMSKKRLFIAIKILPSDKLSTTLFVLKDALSGEKIKWVDAQNLHLTIKFLGDTQTAQVAEISNQLNAIANKHSVFDIELSQLGIFKNFKRPRVLWAGIKTSNYLHYLHNDIDDQLSVLGFEQEQRDFKPHLTLGRMKFINDIPNLKEQILKNAQTYFQKSTIKEFYLIESVLSKTGPTYYVNKSFSLQD